MKKISAFILLVLFAAGPLFSLDMSDVAAYPVPFNPKEKILTVGYPAGWGTGFSGYTLKMKIFDINGDLVTSKARSGDALKWNGRRANGRYVKPGLYILRVEIKNEQGDYGKKIIRILVDY